MELPQSDKSANNNRISNKAKPDEFSYKNYPILGKLAPELRLKLSTTIHS
jgi:hypothetical protein